MFDLIGSQLDGGGGGQVDIVDLDIFKAFDHVSYRKYFVCCKNRVLAATFWFDLIPTFRSVFRG